MNVSHIGSDCRLKHGGIRVSIVGVKVYKAMRGIRPRAQKGSKVKGFRSQAGKNIERVSRNSVREVRDNTVNYLNIGHS